MGSGKDAGQSSSRRKSIRGRIALLFAAIFVLLFTPIILQVYMTYRQASIYRDTIDNITYANQLGTDVSEEIEQEVWDIVAGKVKFEDSQIMTLMADIRSRMVDIRNNTASEEAGWIMEIALRALGTTQDYLDMLKDQIAKNAPVADNEAVLEETRVCVANINDLLQEFSSRQVTEAAYINQEMSRQSNLTLLISMALGVVVLLGGVLAFAYISRSIMNPIGKLLRMSNRLSEGDFNTRVELAASDEFSELATGMNTMSEKIERLLQNSVEEQKQVRMLEYKVLQEQITPHFLYNTLDAIIWAAEARNSTDVITLVTSLSSFFRTSLSHGVDFIPLADEIDHVRSYLAIQQMRYSDVMTYEINVDPDILDQTILKLLLQPLVENSLYHGVKNTRRRGKIIVSAKREGDKIRYSVQDDGVGMTPEKVAALRREIDRESAGEGYGLFNVNRRLKLYYGRQEGIEIQSRPNQGTWVSFVLDYVEKEAQH